MAAAVDALDWMRARLGMGENPPGSNRNDITRWAGMDGQPWCAMTVSEAIDHAFGDDNTWRVPGVAPTYSWGIAYVPTLRDAFSAANLYTVDHASQGNPAPANPGDLVLFDWPGSPLAHVGMVESDPGDGTLVTIEGNTSDQLLRKRRSRSVVNGICRVPYDGAALPAPAPPPGPAGDFLPLDVDGQWGPHTCRATQHALGVDTDGQWGPISKRALQARVGVDQDGQIGPITVRALQRHVGSAQDGDWGPDTTRHLQLALNGSTF